MELKDSQDSHYSHNDIKKYEETIKELINVLEGTNDSIESVDSATNTTVVEKTNKEQVKNPLKQTISSQDTALSPLAKRESLKPCNYLQI